ncbi:MAG: outer membrane protein assembly factor BamA [Phycisphaerae bacterium]
MCALGAARGAHAGVQDVQGAQEMTVAGVRFEGNSALDDAQLRDVAGLRVGDALDVVAVRRGRDAIAARYREAGYRDVVVVVNVDLMQRTGEVVYRVEEGQRARIRSIVFEGAEAFPHRALLRQIRTKKAFWVFRTGAFDATRAAEDAARLRNYYRDRGFLDARVTMRVESGDEPGDLVLVFTIVEGTRYRVEAIRFVGNAEYTDEELLDLMGSRVGDIVRRRRVEEDARAIQTRYQSFGHIYATVRPIRVFSESPGLVIITMEIRERDQYRVGEVIVRGNLRTKDKVVRRALDLYPPDDLFNLTATREAERKLRATQMFSRARVYPAGDQPGVRDVIIDVEEPDRIADLNFSVGVTSNAGLVGSVSLDLKNFDLFDTPRDLAELLRLRAFHGGGQRLRIALQPGTRVSRFRIDFSDPYFLDRPLRFGTSLFSFERGRDGYNESRAGGMISVGKRFERGWLRGWSGEAALRVESVDVDPVASRSPGGELFVSREIREDRGANLLTKISTTLVRDRTDNRFVPTSGDRLRIAYEQAGVLGGGFSFGKLNLAYTWHKTLGTDVLDRKKVLHLRASAGAIVGDAPVFERFYAGGVGSVRGFEFRGIGPRDGVDDNNVGGDSLILLGAEYTFPVYSEALRGLVFVDIGAIDADVRASFGIGARLTLNIPQFGGTIPLEFSIGVPFLRESGDETQPVGFLIGASLY